MNRFFTVLKIESKLAMRCPDGIIFGIGMPICIMILIGIIGGETPVFEGATIPYELFPKALQNIANILPLTHGVKLLKGFSMGNSIDNLYLSIILMLLITIIGFSLSFKLFKWE